MLVDSHAHLDDPRFAADLDEVLDRARAAGVRYIITVGTGVASCEAAVALAARHSGFIFAGVGVHPHEADRADDTVRRRIAELARAPGVVAVGETGLDYHYNHSSHAGQRAVFEWHIELALERNLPLIVHCREAHTECVGILYAYRSRGLRGVAHCFSGDMSQADAFMNLGFHISFAGTLTFSNAESLREVAARIPLDRILVETDCPYLTPVPHRGHRNEPAFVACTAEKMNLLRQEKSSMTDEVYARNAMAFFGLGTTSPRGGPGVV